MSKDLGTYWLKVSFKDGRGYIEKWETGYRYSSGVENWKPIDGFKIPPPFDNEDDLIQTMLYQYLEGNYSCDCNRKLFLLRSMQEEEPETINCGESLKLSNLVLVTPSGEEKEIYRS